MLDFLFLIFDVVTDFFCYKDDRGISWKRFWCRIGGSALVLFGMLVMIPDTALTYVLGGVLIAAGFGLMTVVDHLLWKKLRQMEE